MNKLEEYLEDSLKHYGYEYSDIHLFLESIKGHEDFSLREWITKVKPKILDRFGERYGEKAWCITLRHYSIDKAKREVVIMKKEGDTFISGIKSEKELIHEEQERRREKNGNST